MQSCGIGLFWLLVSLYEVVQNSAGRGFSRTTAPGRLGKISICAVFAPLCKQKPRTVSLRGDRDVGGMV